MSSTWILPPQKHKVRGFITHSLTLLLWVLPQLPHIPQFLWACGLTNPHAGGCLASDTHTNNTHMLDVPEAGHLSLVIRETHKNIHSHASAAAHTHTHTQILTPLHTCRVSWANQQWLYPHSPNPETQLCLLLVSHTLSSSPAAERKLKTAWKPNAELFSLTFFFFLLLLDSCEVYFSGEATEQKDRVNQWDESENSLCFRSEWYCRGVGDLN